MTSSNLIKENENYIKNKKEMFALESLYIYNSLDTIRHKLAFEVPEDWVEDEFVKSRARDFLNGWVPQSKEELEHDLDKRARYFAGILALPFISKEIKEHYSNLFTGYDIRVNGVLLNLDNLKEVQAYFKEEEEKELSVLSPEDRLYDILFKVDSYNRMGKFLEIADTLDDRLYWIGLKHAYSGCDNTYRYRDVLKDLFTTDKDNREFLMSEEERDFLRSLPDIVTVYRAMTYLELESCNYGISWTLNEQRAEYFRDEYRRNHSTAHLEKLVMEEYVSKELIIAYWNDRSEEEVIIVFPE